METFAAGMVMGLSVAAPIGPNGALCIRRSLAAGRGAGFVTGLGAATAHALFVTMAMAGVGLSSALLDPGGVVRGIAGVALIGMGVRALRLNAALTVAPGRSPEASGGRAYVSTLGIALANPLTIASLGALLQSLGAPSGGPVPAVLVVAGVFAGSATWWFALSTTVAALRDRIKPDYLGWLNRASAASIASFGVLVCAQSL